MTSSEFVRIGPDPDGLVAARFMRRPVGDKALHRQAKDKENRPTFVSLPAYVPRKPAGFVRNLPVRYFLVLALSVWPLPVDRTA